MAEPTTKTGILPKDLRADYLWGTICHFRKPEDYSENYLHKKIVAAEDDIERDLGILFQEKRIRSEPDPADTDWDIEEPAYHYDTDFFVDERWGWIRPQRYPILSVQKLLFAYPNFDNPVFNVPLSWIRLDKEFGIIQLVPDRIAVYATFSAFILSIFSGGRGIPQSIFLDYTAGFGAFKGSHQDNLRISLNDLIEHVKYTVLIDILEDVQLPSSFSTSTDGQSQSFSLSMKELKENRDKRRHRFKDKIKGVQMTVI